MIPAAAFNEHFSRAAPRIARPLAPKRAGLLSIPRATLKPRPRRCGRHLGEKKGDGKYSLSRPRARLRVRFGVYYLLAE